MLSRKAKERSTVALVLATMFIVSITITAYLLTAPDRETKPVMQANRIVRYQPAIVIQKGVSADKQEMLQPFPIKNLPVKHKPEITILKNHVIPPMASIAPAPIVQFVDAQQGTTIKSNEGSLVYIPPQAFVNAKGKPVDGKVKVAFTEYHNYKDIFMSGIPMNYKVGDKEEQLESAGMMQLTASIDNNVVYVNPFSKIKVMLASERSSKDYNLYFFDAKKGNWEEKGKDKVVYQKKKLTSSGKLKNVAAYKEPVRQVYVYSFDGVPNDKVFLWWKFPAKEFAFRFTQLSKSYPELKAISGIHWEYKGEDTKEIYSKIFNTPGKGKKPVYRKGIWTKIEVIPAEENGYVTINFSNDKETVAIKVRPKEKNEARLVKVNARLERYFAELKNRQQQDARDYAFYRTDSLRLTYDSTATASLQMDVMRSFEIDNFGIWNCDRVADTKSFVAYDLNFVDENGKAIYPQIIYLVDKDYNSVFTYYPDVKQKVRINPYSTNLIWTVLPGGKLGIVKPDQLLALAAGKRKQKLTMQVSDNALTSIEDVRAELQF